MNTEHERTLLNALRPFASLGDALIKHHINDNSEWTRIPDDCIVLRGGLDTWYITAGQLRKAYLAMELIEDEDKTDG